MSDEAVKAEVEALKKNPEFALAIMYALIDAAPALEFPRLIAQDEEDGPELVCPHCGTGTWKDALVVVDLATRWTYASNQAYDFKEHEIHFEYDGDSDFSGLHYRCGNCEHAVALPEGWKEI